MAKKKSTINLWNLTDDEVADELGKGLDKTDIEEYTDEILREGVRRILLNQSSSEASGSAEGDGNSLESLVKEIKEIHDKLDEITRMIDQVN